LKVRDVLRGPHEEGWYVARERGGHRQLKHPDKPGRVTVAGKPGEDVPIATLRSIARQAGWED
jgi:predicted RNA binding protein YcfA (HicA-like mRNA interferase family)